MKVILLQHVKKIGRAGDIVDVSDGYAQNALFPKKLAQQATAQVINKHRQQQKSLEIQELKEKEEILRKLELLKGKTVVLKEKLNQKGTLYHAIGLKEIIRAIKDQYNISVPNTLFTETYKFQESGEHNVVLSAYDTSISCTISIQAKK